MRIRCRTKTRALGSKYWNLSIDLRLLAMDQKWLTKEWVCYDMEALVLRRIGLRGETRIKNCILPSASEKQEGQGPANVPYQGLFFPCPSHASDFRRFVSVGFIICLSIMQNSLLPDGMKNIRIYILFLNSQCPCISGCLCYVTKEDPDSPASISPIHH